MKAKAAGGKAAARTKAAPKKATAAKAARADAPAGDKPDKPDKHDKDDRDRGDRSKRLLDLVMLLLRARSPVTYREIREQFVAYQTANVEAGLRAFERDKADLLELGVPIRYITPEEDDSLEDGGYVIDVKRFRMPEVRLTADEVSALVLAASVARAIPGGTYPKIVDLALKKLAFDLPEPSDTPTDFLAPARPSGRPRDTVLVHFPDKPGASAMGENVAVLEPAIRFRKRVTFSYTAAGNGVKTKRDVDPYALAYREGAWVLVGWCHLRKEIRSFRVDRMSDAVMAPKPKSPDFERPESFDVRTYVSRSPWTFASEPPETVELALALEAADTAAEDFGEGAEKRTVGDTTFVRFACTNPDFAASQVLKAKGAIVVREGARLKKRIADELAAVAGRYA
jgi:proteasome accessory factor B